MLKQWLHQVRGHATTRIPVTVFTPSGPLVPLDPVLVAELHLRAAIRDQNRQGGRDRGLPAAPAAPAARRPPGAAAAAQRGNAVVRVATAPVPSLAVSDPSQVVRVGVLGCGNVGAALVELIGRQAKVIEARTGLRLEVARVAVRNLARERDVDLPPGLLTRDATRSSTIRRSTSSSR